MQISSVSVFMFVDREDAGRLQQRRVERADADQSAEDLHQDQRHEQVEPGVPPEQLELGASRPRSVPAKRPGAPERMPQRR